MGVTHKWINSDMIFFICPRRAFQEKKCNIFALAWYGYCNVIRYFQSILRVLHWWNQTTSNHPKGITFHQINLVHVHYLDEGNAQVDQNDKKVSEGTTYLQNILGLTYQCNKCIALLV